MERLKERYLTDEQGKRVAVVLDIQDYERLLETLEELEAIHAYDAAKAANDEVMPLEVAIAEIEQKHFAATPCPKRVSEVTKARLCECARYITGIS